MSLTQSAMAVTVGLHGENAFKRRIFIDTDSIKKKKGQTVSYWEYRLVELNNAFLENDVAKPLYGVVIRWSADCGAKTQRLSKKCIYQ
jgi:hypothetical protein